MATKVEKEKNVEKAEKEVKVERVTKSELKRLLKDAEIDIVSNDKAQLVYKCPRTFQEIYLDSYGDTESVSMDLLQSMKSKARDFFTKYWIILEDVYIPNSNVDVSIEDVYEYLGLSNVYNNIKDFDSNYFDNILLKDSLDKFEKRVEKMDKKLLTQLVLRGVTLYNEETFNDSRKIRILEEMTGKEDLFRDSEPIKKNKK